jgi:hypothetical protein
MAAITHEHVIELVRSLPAEQLGSLYDFALFLKERRPLIPDEQDIFGESVEDIQADEAWWDEQFEKSQSALLRLAEEAAGDYRVGQKILDGELLWNGKHLPPFEPVGENNSDLLISDIVSELRS